MLMRFAGIGTLWRESYERGEASAAMTMTTDEAKFVAKFESAIDTAVQALIVAADAAREFGPVKLSECRAFELGFLMRMVRRLQFLCGPQAGVSRRRCAIVRTLSEVVDVLLEDGEQGKLQ
jgi:hypothetical protein